MDEIKILLESLVQNCLKARNEADEKEKDEENEDYDKKDKTVSNEDVDKRKLIDEVGGILEGEVDEEVWRTIISKIEKLAYDKPEAGMADDKAKNSIDELVNGIYSFAEVQTKPAYISPKKGIELGEQIYGAK